MTHLFDVVPEAEYHAAVDAGHIRVRPHFDAPLLIHNYTEACVWEGGWNDATRACRGLITHADTGVVVARPFRKFWNVGQPEAEGFDPTAPVVVTEKADGSLGILYRLPDGSWAMSTRGSFHSAQADWATDYYNLHHSGFDPNPAWTYLFEIIYSDNRIVLEYDFEGLVLLGAVDIATGRSVPLEDAQAGWGGRVVETHPYGSLEAVLASGQRDDREGFVVHNPVTDERVKVKHDEYIRLHRLMTNTTEKHVWEALAAGDNPAAVFASAPDEFHQWLRAVQGAFMTKFTAVLDSVEDVYGSVVTELNAEHGTGRWGRKEFAEKAKQSPFTSMLFTLLDGNDISPAIWRSLKPVGETTGLRVVTEDTN